jgi:hypothetical protein
LEGLYVLGFLVGIMVGPSDTALGMSVGIREGATDGKGLGALVSLILTGALVITRCIVGLAVGLITGGQDSFSIDGNVGSSVAMMGRLVGIR